MGGKGGEGWEGGGGGGMGRGMRETDGRIAIELMDSYCVITE